MPKKDIKTYSNYREGVFQQENEPEEGEIVDDYELIVSSDEELSMRQRIRELEAENAEIEQIAVISRSYVDEFKPLRNNLDKNRAARVPTDASSISSTEFVTPKKRKRRRSKERKRKHCHHRHQHHHHHHQQQQQHQHHDEEKLPQHNSSKSHSHTRKPQCKRRLKIIAKKHAKVHSDRYMCKEISNDSVNLDSPDSSSSTSSLTDDEISSKNIIPYNRKDDVYNFGSYITRDTLRLAVARNSTDSKVSVKKSCLKDKLLKQELVSYASNAINDEDDADDNDDDDVEVIEPEVDIQTVDEDSSEDSMEEKELRLIALKSAVLKKHMARKRRNAEAAYSPTDFDTMLSSGILPEGETKLVSIDVVDLEEDDSQNACVIVSPEASPQLMLLDDQDESQQMMDCKPVDMDIANSDSEDATTGIWPKKFMPTLPTFSYASHQFAKQFDYGGYMHEIELPPPPPGVDDYEEPPPPPCFKTYNAELQDMELDNDEFVEEVSTETKTNISPECLQIKDISVPMVKHEAEEVEEEEEEEALRALLLSKFQSPKNQKKLQLEQNRKELKEDSNLNATEQSKDQCQTKPKKPTEFILKEAVKRLKIHSQTDIKLEMAVDQNLNDDSKENNFKLFDYKQESNDSTISLGALRKRLIELKTQSQPVEKDEIIKEMDETQQKLAQTNHETFEAETEKGDINTNIEMQTLKEVTNENVPLLNDSSKVDSTMETNGVDISDITRRLQKLKDAILSATAKKSLQEETHTEELVNELDQGMINSSFGVQNLLAEGIEKIDSSKQILDNILPTYNSFHNSVDNYLQQTENEENVISRDKIVKADFDATKNVTTFKITISNSAALTTEHKDITNNLEDSSLKENSNVNVNIPSKDLPKTVVKHQDDIKKITPESKSTAAKSKSSISLPNTAGGNKVLVTALPKIPSLLTTKIVKPNKVINKNLDIKRKLPAQSADLNSSTKIPKAEPSILKTVHTSRLITSMDQVKHMCKISQFVISVQNSSNESSDDEWGDYDCLYKPLYDYNDNASPLSLNMESPCRTPIRSNSPVDTTINNNKETGFEEKIDKFLKTVRTTVQTENTAEKTPQSTKQIGKTNKTPLAVRHLPAAAQSEYRRLVHRMKLLEDQRKSANPTENTIDTNEQIQSSDALNNAENDTTSSAANSSVSKTSLVKQVLIRNANNNTTSSESQTNGSKESEPPKFPKTNVLRSYENLYVKIGAGIVNHLDKSIKLVEEAKKAKISKLKLENRLKELKAEMDILQSKHKEEQQKISRIYPSICTTNDVITSLKQKRSKVFKAALNLGRTIKGDEYRLNNELKQSIITKTKQLDKEIKLVNSLKAQDIANMEDIFQKNKTKEVSEDEKKETEKKAVRREDQKCQEKEKTEELNSIKDNTVCAVDKKEDDITVSAEENKGENDDTSTTLSTTQVSSNTEVLDPPVIPQDDKESHDLIAETETTNEVNNGECEKQTRSSYISPLEHLRNMDSNMDPNGVVCPYDLMGNCEDANCKYVHISPKIIKTS